MKRLLKLSPNCYLIIYIYKQNCVKVCCFIKTLYYLFDKIIGRKIASLVSALVSCFWFKTNKDVGLHIRPMEEQYNMALDEVFKNSPERRHFALLSSSHLERL